MAAFGRGGFLCSFLAVCRMMKCHAREMRRCTNGYDGLPRRGYPSSGLVLSVIGMWRMDQPQVNPSWRSLGLGSFVYGFCGGI
ncbi:conserved protein of unknown function [Pseudomonas marincola]|uniref:Uncharacterized protein n=1 Tax=Pseudomonas marincola TaxID=437900 RepID=A0A653EBA1_9PSED|nr:conserved protein of unknown function [Pseudomonas marincola]